MSDDTFDLYRCDSEGGNGTKDWAIFTTSDRITVKYGKTGSKLRTQEIPTHFPESEKWKRIDAQRKQGYSHMGRVTFSAAGTMSNFADFESKVWNLAQVDKSKFIVDLKQFAEDLNDYSFNSSSPLMAVFDPVWTGITFTCNGHLPKEGWTLSEGNGLTAITGSNFIIGGGKVVNDMQLLILVAINAKMGNDLLTAVASKGSSGTERDLIPSKQGLPNEFIKSLLLPVGLVREVAMATGLITKPIPLFAQGSESKASGIFF